MSLDRGLCRTEQYEHLDWFPDMTDPMAVATVQAVCAGCPVAVECLELVESFEGNAHHKNRYGVFAGTTPKQRWRRSKARREVSSGSQT